jgi:hypothetical protein
MIFKYVISILASYITLVGANWINFGRLLLGSSKLPTKTRIANELKDLISGIADFGEEMKKTVFIKKGNLNCK